MRDKLKDMEYFNNFIDEELARVNNFSNNLKNGEIKADRILPVKMKIHDLKIGILIARYSKGDEISLLEQEYSNLVDAWEEVWEPESYNKTLRMISLAALFQIDKTRIERIKDMLKKSDIHDWVFDFILNSLVDEQTDVCEKLLFPKYLSILPKVVTEENKIELLRKYLSKWYNGDCGCYGAHKSKQNIYYGYWSFEAGAIAKILNLDDSNLKNVKYYPYDLVHYKTYMQPSATTL